MSQPVYGRIMNYRKGIRAQNSHECLVQFVNVDSQEQVGKLMGQKVSWNNGKSEHFGKITSFHGKNGVAIVRFKKGVPGQAIGTNVQIVG